MTVRVFAFVAALAAMQAISQTALAGDATPQPSVEGNQLNTNLEEVLPKHAFREAQRNDADATLDLEATRTDLNRRGGPAISLGVSGRVEHQVMGVR
jgi:hypothetical protein